MMKSHGQNCVAINSTNYNLYLNKNKLQWTSIYQFQNGGGMHSLWIDQNYVFVLDYINNTSTKLFIYKLIDGTSNILTLYTCTSRDHVTNMYNPAYFGVSNNSNGYTTGYTYNYAIVGIFIRIRLLVVL